ncbi:MAG TPA: hypothetical protein VFS00_20665 [Polyangiaceae bacterium]|nr:hypothetical protein [Polyangiaceae bacterium]
MRSLFVVVGVLLMAGALAGGCQTTFAAVVSFEPPHPEWITSLDAPPESRRPRPMPAGEHVVWVTQVGPGQCTLEVRRGDGSLVGRDEGDEKHECSVAGRAERDELWTMNATSTSAAATVYAGASPPLFPPPARAALAGWLALFALGAVLFRKARSAGRAPAAGP